MTNKQMLQRAWINMLRSGHYKQGKKRLCGIGKEGAEYCCLGVLHRVLGGKFTFNGFEMTVNGINSGGEPDRNATGYPSKTTLRKVGLTPNDAKELASMNDRGESFNEIADHLEKKFGLV